MAPASKPPVAVHFSRRALILLGLVVLLPWVTVVAFLINRHPVEPVAGSQPLAAAAEPNVFHCKPGPWGNLQYSRILIEPPEEQVTANYKDLDQVIWTFPGYDREKLNALWISAGLTSREQDTINAPALRHDYAGGIQIAAPRDFVMGLNRTARTILYSALAAFVQNPAQNEPFRFRADQEDEWFADSGLSPDTIAQVKRLVYRRGNSLLFSDQALLIPRIPSLAERVRLVKALARKSTMIVKLEIRPDSDIDAIADYWSYGSSAKDIQPLLQSMQRSRQVMTLDIIHLLPRFARSLLYTYPSAADPASLTYLDCHWTSLNFFNVTADPRYQDLNEVTQAFRNDYHPVTSPPKFGDIYLFAKPDGDIIHSCVHIADDIVFTKNGASPSAPWIFMSLADVVAFYPSDKPLDIQRYRARTGPGH